MTDLIAELAEVVRLSADDDHDSMIGAGYAVRFIRAHHAEIEAMARDAARWNHCVSVGRFPAVCQDGESWMAWRSVSPTSNVRGHSPSGAIDQAMHDGTLEKAPDGTPARWQCRYKNCEWQNIGKREYESLIGDWDYELRTINVVSNDSSID